MIRATAVERRQVEKAIRGGHTSLRAISAFIGLAMPTTRELLSQLADQDWIRAVDGVYAIPFDDAANGADADPPTAFAPPPAEHQVGVDPAAKPSTDRTVVAVARRAEGKILDRDFELLAVFDPDELLDALWPEGLAREGAEIRLTDLVEQGLRLELSWRVTAPQLAKRLTDRGFLVPDDAVVTVTETGDLVLRWGVSL